MAFLFSRKWAFRTFLATAVAASVLGAGWWYYHTSRPEYRLRRGQEAIRQGDWDTVYAIADQLAVTGESDRALLLSGEALAHKGDFASALQTLNHIEDRGALRFQAAVLSARCLLEMRLLREAHGVYLWILEQDPENVDAYRGLGAIAYDLGQLAQAVEYLERVAELDPADGRPHRLIGLIAKDLGRFDEARSAYEEALRRQLPPPTRLSVRRELAEVLLNQHHYAEALAAVDDLPGPAEAGDAAMRAEALSGLGRKEEATVLLESASKAYPDDAALARLRGECFLADGQPRRAIECLERAVRIAPRDVVAPYQLGLAYAAADRPADAAEQRLRVEVLRGELKRLTDLSREAMDKPWDAEVRLKLAALYKQWDDPRLAAMWEEAAKACARR